MSDSPTVSTLLVANRGEIALRVIRAAHARGLRTVAVYSDADRDAPHVRAADVAVRIGPTPAAESYLSIAAILKAARRTGADAVHPGYGFLSERAEFARAVTGAGLTFVGPSADVMEQMGRKDAARRIAVDAGVPVVPVGDSAAGMQFPVLVKAAAGGGGKGMRIVRDAADFAAALDAARREAQSAFGDGTVLVERYVEQGRHVEVQIMADHHGNVVHLFERDCSAQRRHQKVIEEAPAPTVTPEVRRLLTDSAVALARQVGYTNAGTVEFLVSNGEVFFLEMNTRLQVEHPVTELVTGLDLVDLQLAVAAGEPLPFAQDDIRLRGHAMEARVYAEDAFNGFLPQAGTATYVRWSPRARNDVALESGAEVTTAYDPMLGKVIVHGTTREATRQALVTALDDTAVLGLTTNLGFLRALADSAAFRDHEVHTAWLDTHTDALQPPTPEIAAIFAAWAVATHQMSDRSPFGCLDGWRLAGQPAPVSVALGNEVIVVSPHAGKVGDHTVRPIASEPDVLRLEVDGLVHEASVHIGAHRVEVAHMGHTVGFHRPDPFGPSSTTATGDGTVLAPMPGTVLAVEVTVGQAVQPGEVLGVMEAMKMELSLKAPVAGTVTYVGATVGEQVAMGSQLFVVEPVEGF